MVMVMVMVKVMVMVMVMAMVLMKLYSAKTSCEKDRFSTVQNRMFHILQKHWGLVIITKTQIIAVSEVMNVSKFRCGWPIQ